MAQPYVGEIRMFAGNFAPAGWMFCEGQLLPISEYETLFNLIGTTYGGDGQSTFALPDLRGRVPIHQGNGFMLAETGGVEEVTLTGQPDPGAQPSAARDIGHRRHSRHPAEQRPGAVDARRSASTARTNPTVQLERGSASARSAAVSRTTTSSRISASTSSSRCSASSRAQT